MPSCGRPPVTLSEDGVTGFYFRGCSMGTNYVEILEGGVLWTQLVYIDVGLWVLVGCVLVFAFFWSLRFRGEDMMVYLLIQISWSD